MKGLVLWIMTKIQYDAYGNAEILQSFVKPAQESPIKGKKKPINRSKPKPAVKSGEKELW